MSVSELAEIMPLERMLFSMGMDARIRQAVDGAWIIPDLVNYVPEVARDLQALRDVYKMMPRVLLRLADGPDMPAIWRAVLFTTHAEGAYAVT